MSDEFQRWRTHVDKRLDEQDSLLREIRDTLGASRMGLAALKWLIGVGAGLAAIWVALKHGVRP